MSALSPPNRFLPGFEPHRFSVQLCDAAVAGLALWTVCCHAVVLTGGSLHRLLALFAGVLSIYLVYMVWLWLRRSSRRPAPDGPAPDDTEQRPAPNPARQLEDFAMPTAASATLATIGILAALTLAPTGRWLELWSVIALLLVLAAAWSLWRPMPEAPPGVAGDHSQASPELDRGKGWALLALAFASMTLALCAHGSNADDAFYVGLAVSAVEAPSSPLIAGDPMHGIEGLPLYIAIYRVHSWEMLIAAVAYLTGMPAIAVFHLGATALTAFLMPLAYAALLRRLLPRDWLLATFLVMVVLAVPGDAIRWYGQFAYQRPWQGKSVFLSVLTPLLYVYALRFADRPSLPSWMRLAGAQIAAVGLTGSALWAAPVAVALGLVVGLWQGFARWPSLGRRTGLARRTGIGRWSGVSSLRALALGLASSLYLLVLGASLKSSVKGSVAAPSSMTPDERMREMVEMIFGAGSPWLWTVSAAAVAAAWAVVPAGGARRFALLVPLGAWLTLLNPFLSDWLIAHLLHRPHWRALWALPTPILIACLLLAPLYLARWWNPPWLTRPRRQVLCLALAALFALLVPRVYMLSTANGVTLETPRLKVPAPDYHRAEAVTRAYAPGTLVAAPPGVNTWLPTFEGRVRPLFVRFYLRRQEPFLGAEELRRREFIPKLVAGDTDWPAAPKALRRELEGYPEIGGVVLIPSKQRPAYREVLISLGFTKLSSPQAEALDVDLWQRPLARPQDPSPGSASRSVQGNS